MVASINSNNSNRKGIYRDLYREFDIENTKREKSFKMYNQRKSPKGIYAELYRHIELENNMESQTRKNGVNGFSVGEKIVQAMQMFVNIVATKVSYFFSAAKGGFRALIVACMVVKRPINSYVENRISSASKITANRRIYCNDR